MDDLVQFLRARLDEDEAAARLAAEPESWMQLNRQSRPDWYVQFWADPDVAAVVADPESSAYPVVATPQGMEADDAEARADHIARHDPARVLAEVDAKRQVLDRYENQAVLLANHMGGILTKHLVQELRAVVQLLALPYASHPDYQPAWAPDPA